MIFIVLYVVFLICFFVFLSLKLKCMDECIWLEFFLNIVINICDGLIELVV